MSHFLLNLARRAAGLAPVARINPTAPPPPVEAVPLEALEEVTADAPVRKSPPLPTAEPPPELKLEDLLVRLRREMAVVPRIEAARPEAPRDDSRTDPPEAPPQGSGVGERAAASGPQATPTGPPPRRALPREPEAPRPPVETPVVPSRARPAEPRQPAPTPAPSSKPPSPPPAAPSAAPPAGLEKTTVIEVVKVVPVSVAETAPERRKEPPPSAPPAKVRDQVEADTTRLGALEKTTTRAQPQTPARSAKAREESGLATPKPVAPPKQAPKARTGEDRPAAPEARVPKPDRGARRSSTVSMPKPAPAPVLPKRIAEPAKAAAPQAEKPIEVRIGTLEVRGSPPPPAPQPTAPQSPRREGFDSYRSVRDYSGWFRG